MEQYQAIEGVRPPDIDHTALAARYMDPECTEFVCYVDGGCMNNGRPNARAYGSFKIFKNDKELVHQDMLFSLVAPSTKTKPGRATNNMAEAMAINKLLTYLATSTIFKNSRNTVIIRSDSELTIKQIKGIYKIKDIQLLNIAKDRSHILNRIEKKFGVNPWERIVFSKIARNRIVEVLGH